MSCKSRVRKAFEGGACDLEPEAPHWRRPAAARNGAMSPNFRSTSQRACPWPPRAMTHDSRRNPADARGQKMRASETFRAFARAPRTMARPLSSGPSAFLQRKGCFSRVRAAGLPRLARVMRCGLLLARSGLCAEEAAAGPPGLPRSAWPWAEMITGTACFPAGRKRHETPFQRLQG